MVYEFNLWIALALLIMYSIKFEMLDVFYTFKRDEIKSPYSLANNFTGLCRNYGNSNIRIRFVFIKSVRIEVEFSRNV